MAKQVGDHVKSQKKLLKLLPPSSVVVNAYGSPLIVRFATLIDAFGHAFEPGNPDAPGYPPYRIVYIPGEDL